VVLAAEVARRLGAELDVLVARKLGAPFSAELAIGAVTANGGRFLNEQAIRELPVSPSYLERITALEREEAKRREERFREGRPPAPVEGRTVVLVDDGLATGSTMLAAIRSVRPGNPARLIVAVPVAPPATVARLAREADEVVCPSQPEPFGAVGWSYDEFWPTSDEEVIRLLRAGRSATALTEPSPAEEAPPAAAAARPGEEAPGAGAAAAGPGGAAPAGAGHGR
jgi:putative phosphoribosyl transferase